MRSQLGCTISFDLNVGWNETALIVEPRWFVLSEFQVLVSCPGMLGVLHLLLVLSTGVNMNKETTEKSFATTLGVPPARSSRPDS